MNLVFDAQSLSSDPFPLVEPRSQRPRVGEI